MQESLSWKTYQITDYIKSGLNYRWNWAVARWGKPELKYIPTVEKIAGKKILSVEETYEFIASKIKCKTPFFAGRFGQTELNMIVQVLNVRYGRKKDERQIALENLCTNAGFFPMDMQLGERFVDMILNELSNVDLHGVWPLYMEEYFVEKYERNVHLTKLGYLQPFHVSRESEVKPWSHALEGKNVLVIHPFAETIECQYNNHREAIFSNVFEANDILPKFNLITLKAVQTIAGNRDTRFDTWFDALEWMKRECEKIDFDVAIIGCGAYGFPLASEIKRMGKVAIHMAGSTQLMFGIRGKRWESADNEWYKAMLNEAWVRPSKKENVPNSEKIENGCYW